MENLIFGPGEFVQVVLGNRKRGKVTGKVWLNSALCILYTVRNLPAVAKGNSFCAAVQRLWFYKDNSGSGSDNATGEHSGKDSLFRHDAVTGLVINRTAGVAFLADLGDFQQSGAERESAAYRERNKVNPCCGDILCKIASADRQPHGNHFVDAFLGKKAHLAVPVTGMGIPCYPVFPDKFNAWHRFFPFTFIEAGADSQNCC
jgi:hypothetical protein